jgi:hypothetical protein
MREGEAWKVQRIPLYDPWAERSGGEEGRLGRRGPGLYSGREQNGRSSSNRLSMAIQEMDRCDNRRSERVGVDSSGAQQGPVTEFAHQILLLIFSFGCETCSA